MYFVLNIQLKSEEAMVLKNTKPTLNCLLILALIKLKATPDHALQ